MLHNARTKYLDKKTILSILKEVLDKDSQVTYSVKISKTSLSIYIRLYLKDTNLFISRRISDHKSNSDIKTLLVGPTTKYKHVRNFITSALRRLKHMRVNQLFREIEGVTDEIKLECYGKDIVEETKDKIETTYE